MFLYMKKTKTQLSGGENGTLKGTLGNFFNWKKHPDVNFSRKLRKNNTTTYLENAFFPESSYIREFINSFLK
jgi:hypothetical protein